MTERTPVQWANMLIEWVEPEDICNVFQRFATLVSVGIEPEHAFAMVTDD